MLVGKENFGDPSIDDKITLVSNIQINTVIRCGLN